MVANLQFTAENAGTYHFRILVDGNLVKTIPLRIAVTPADDEQELWDEIERISPSNEVLLAYAASMRKPPR